MADYALLASRLHAVRRAWKRTAAVSGLAIVFVESAGIFALLLLADWIYGARLLPRVIAYVAAVTVVLYLLARHVLRPIFRRITDEQIALYV